MLETSHPPPRSVFGLRDFRLLFAGAAASKLGNEVVLIALPLVAVLTLHASPAQVGLLGSATMVAFLLVGLPAGAWVDRMRRRGVMIVADISRALLMASIPVAWWLDILTIHQLFAVALLSGIGTVFFDVSAQSFLPSVVGRENLVDGNAKLSGIDAVSRIAGPGLGGYLVGVFSAPASVVVTAAGFLWSGICVVLIPGREPAPTTNERRHLAREVRDGLRHVLGEPALRAIAVSGAVSNFFLSFIMTMLPVLFARELDMSPAAIGVFFAIGGVGAVLGAITVSRFIRLLGHGPLLWVLPMVVGPVYVLIPLANRGGWFWLACVAYLLLTTRTMVENVVQVSYRQRVTPDGLLGRMNATVRFLMWGAIAIGSAVSGLIAEYQGVRTALWIGALGLAVAWLPILFSPLRGMRELPPAAGET